MSRLEIIPVKVVRKIESTSVQSIISSLGCQGALTRYFITAQDNPEDNPTPIILANTPTVAYSTPKIPAILFRLAPRIFSTADSFNLLYLVDATEPERIIHPATIVKADIKSTSVFKLLTTPSLVFTISRVDKAVIFGRALTTACCNSNSLLSGTFTVAT